jgi:hypothetical protein
MPFLQDVIHKIEVGGGMRHIRRGLAVLAVLFLIVTYNLRNFRNMSTQEAMDSAQVGRNIAEGKGFSTLFVRPFSIYLVKSTAMSKADASAEAGKTPDYARLKSMHPDISNPPLYPVFLAGLMKVLPFDYTISTKPFWSNAGKFWRFQPDFLIAVSNQVLFIIAVLIVFLLARRLFDSGVAWMSALLFLFSEVFWRFSVSGLSTMLLLVIFLGLLWALVLLEQEVREPKRGVVAFLGLAALAGLLIGFGCLTRYAFGWLVIPAVAYVAIFGGPRRVPAALLVFGLFLVVVTPWVVRNISLSGLPFGTASYALFENSPVFQEYRLARSLEPNLANPYAGSSTWYLFALRQKLFTNLRPILTNDLPRLGGTWATAFFLAGLLLSYRSPALRRLRYFVLMALGIAVLAQALGRTYLSEDSPEINGENLLVLFAPIVIIFGVGLFYVLLEQMILPIPELRFAVIGGFGAVMSLPMVFAFLPPKIVPVVFPPYYPPAIQDIAGWVEPKEMIMTDVPWAVAWYGNRQAVWLTLRALPDPAENNVHEDFFAVHDYLKPVNLLYLTPVTMDSRFLTSFLMQDDYSWGKFVWFSLSVKQVPAGFPLRESQKGWLPSQLMLTDWARWTKAKP